MPLTSALFAARWVARNLQSPCKDHLVSTPRHDGPTDATSKWTTARFQSISSEVHDTRTTD